jgi:hypothetical protein
VLARAKIFTFFFLFYHIINFLWVFFSLSLFVCVPFYLICTASVSPPVDIALPFWKRKIFPWKAKVLLGCDGYVGLQRFGVFSVIEGTHTHTQKKKKRERRGMKFESHRKKGAKTEQNQKISLCLKFIFFQLLLWGRDVNGGSCVIIHGSVSCVYIWPGLKRMIFYQWIKQEKEKKIVLGREREKVS